MEKMEIRFVSNFEETVREKCLPHPSIRVNLLTQTCALSAHAKYESDLISLSLSPSFEFSILDISKLHL